MGQTFLQIMEKCQERVLKIRKFKKKIRLEMWYEMILISSKMHIFNFNNEDCIEQ